MSDTNLELMAHLMRRAGFGASRDELERRVTVGYEETVEELLHPETQEPVDYYEFLRYFPLWWKPGTMGGNGHAGWVWRMINTQAPLQEKLCLFYHQLFATGVAKVDHYDEIEKMIDMFRARGLDNYKTILMEIARSPAMIYWLDNHENHATSVNENWGRELLELFTMGIGNYTETDVRECSRAFTGWTVVHKLPRFHMGRFDWEFDYRPEDHDDGEKTFLGHTGNFNGEEIVDIILAQPATANFIARHLYSFFVADEAQVPAWSVTPPNDPEAVQFIADALMDNDHQSQESNRSRNRHAQARWQHRAPVAAVDWLVARDRLHGPGPDESAKRGRLALRHRVDQQRHSNEAHQFCCGIDQRARSPGRGEHYRPAEIGGQFT